MKNIIFPLALFLLFGSLFTNGQTVFSQNSYISVNITAKQALKKKFLWCKVTSTVKHGYKTANDKYKRKVLTFEQLDTIENSITALFKLGLSNKTINNKTPRDCFLLLFPYSQKINDTAFYLYAPPPADTSFAITNRMGSYPGVYPPVIYFDRSGMTRNIISGGGGGSECCAGGDRWTQTIWFKDNICYSYTSHTQGQDEEIVTEYDPSHSYPITIKKSVGNNSGYSKTSYSYFFKRGILYKMTELIEGKTPLTSKTIIYKFHYKKENNLKH